MASLWSALTCTAGWTLALDVECCGRVYPGSSVSSTDGRLVFPRLSVCCRRMSRRNRFCAARDARSSLAMPWAAMLPAMWAPWVLLWAENEKSRIFRELQTKILGDTSGVEKNMTGSRYVEPSERFMDGWVHTQHLPRITMAQYRQVSTFLKAQKASCKHETHQSNNNI